MALTRRQDETEQRRRNTKIAKSIQDRYQNTGVGGTNYNEADASTREQIEQNEKRLDRDYDYVQSEIDRAKEVIKSRKAQGQDTSAQTKYLDRLQDSLTENPTFERPYFRDQTRDRVQQEIENAIARQRQAINSQVERQEDAIDNAISQNRAALQDQIENYRTQQAQANNEAAQFQNRRGGFYSGGLDYQRGQIGQATTEAISDAQRDVQGRNAELRSQLANLEQSAAEQIQLLETQAPDLIRQRVQEAMQRFDQMKLQEAGLTGVYQGQPTVQAQQANWQQDFAQQQFDFERQMREQTFQSEQERLNYERALQRLQIYGRVMNEEDAQILGVPVGTTTFAVQQSMRSGGGGSRGSSGGGSAGGSVGSSSAWANLDPIDQMRYTEMYQSGTPQQQQWLAQTFPEVFQGGSGTAGVNQRDFNIFLQQFQSQVGDLANAGANDVRQFVNGFYAQGAINDQQADVVENFLMNRVSQARTSQQQMDVQRQRQQRAERSQAVENITERYNQYGYPMSGPGAG